MTLAENKNFESISLYKTLNIEEITSTLPTEHLSKERQSRFELALRLNRAYRKDKSFTQAEIDKVFLIDKGHVAGKEIHIVTKKGIIFILNERKFLNGYNSFITILLGRPNQVKRLYDACKLDCPIEILDFCSKWQSQHYNAS